MKRFQRSCRGGAVTVVPHKAHHLQAGGEGEHRVSRRRLTWLRLFVVLAFVLLAVRLWQLQILEGDRYRLQAAGNRFTLQTVPAPRGVIYDRIGRILARNVVAFDVTIVPASVPEAQEEAILRALATMLDIPLDNYAALAQARLGNDDVADGPPPLDPNCGEPGLLECFRAAKETPYRPLLVGRDVAPEKAFQLLEQTPFLPGVFVDPKPKRRYLYGPLLSHILGYMLPVSQEFLEQAPSSEEYELVDEAGVAGVEASFERELRGRKGRKLVEKDVFGREVRALYEVPPEPGYNIFLTIDLDLQRAATEALRRGLEEAGSPRGAVVALDPRDGQVLALVSLPAYDNNLFVGPISPDEYQMLLADTRKPLFNTAISGAFAPGSIFKLVTASAALQEGVITPQTRLNAPGIIYLPNKYFPDDPSLAQPFYDWLPAGHGVINVVRALARSSDVFFYKVAGGFPGEIEGLGIERLARWARMFGLGELTRVDLPGEVTGLVPTPAWKRQAMGETWVTGDTYNLAIGQGFLTVTPLQMANVTAAVANGGILYRPQLVYQIQDAEGNVVWGFQPDILRHVPVDPATLAIVREGMRGAVAWPDGTASFAGLPTSVAVAGKTGTAEYCDPLPDLSDCRRNENGYLVTHAWFTAFAPYENPEIVVLVFVHGNGRDVLEGSKVAAPIAAEILRYWFEERGR
ncbi:MAG: penicillin-binding protein 2 [Ardenticatenia bacterium]|nr:penicillin-binding protein 2 [Ardenticatenia bacterium]